MSKLQQKIEQAHKQGRIALIPFLTAGFPNLNEFWVQLKQLDDNGADIIEIGVPFSDPVADGPVVEMASVRALELGVSLGWILAELKNRQGQFKAELVLMGYYNPFLQYGLKKFAKDAAACGVSGVIIPDLPLNEDAEIRAALEAEGLDLISLVGPNTIEERMREYAKVAKGYVYVVSVMGITGVREGLAEAVKPTLERANRAFSNLPIVLGFGVKEPSQLVGVNDKLKGVVFGSALINYIEQGGSAAEFMKKWV